VPVTGVVWTGTPAPQRLDQCDAAGDADGEHDDRHQPLGGEAPVTVADEDAEPDGVPAHVGDEQAGEREESDGVDVPATTASGNATP
jgi:hypothetical protein